MMYSYIFLIFSTAEIWWLRSHMIPLLTKHKLTSSHTHNSSYKRTLNANLSINTQAPQKSSFERNTFWDRFHIAPCRRKTVSWAVNTRNASPKSRTIFRGLGANPTTTNASSVHSPAWRNHTCTTTWSTACARTPCHCSSSPTGRIKKSSSGSSREAFAHVAQLRVTQSGSRCQMSPRIQRRVWRRVRKENLKEKRRKTKRLWRPMHRRLWVSNLQRRVQEEANDQSKKLNSWWPTCSHLRSNFCEHDRLR